MGRNEESTDKQLNLDAYQRVVFERLQVLHGHLTSVENNPKFNFSSLFKGNASRIEGRPKGIYIHGAVGRGKTKLMTDFFKEVAISQKRCVHHHHFMAEVHNKINRKLVRGKEAGGDGALIRFAKQLSTRTKLLCFDDFHVTDIGDAMVLGPLFKALIESGMVIVITSNRDPDSLYKNGINRERFIPFIDLVKSCLEIVKLDGALDYRAQFIASSEVYFTPLTDVTAKKLEKIFYGLSGGVVSKEGNFMVKGRTIKIDQVVQGVAMTTFNSLCAKNLSVNDYINLQASFHTLIMSDIPRLGKDNYDEAKRFVGLIDVLYEHRVNFICSAEVPPEGLYSRGHGSFEFSRTVSRLKEMQSKEYISKAHQP